MPSDIKKGILKMNKTSITILLVFSMFQLESVSAASLAKSQVREKLLTHNKRAIQDPFYQLKSMKIRELTDEEALKYVNDEQLITKEFVGAGPGIGGIIPGGIPTIPPIPPQAGNNPAGGLSTGTGPGGNTLPSQPNGVFSGIIMIIDQLIAIGEKIIPTIDKGRAVVINNPMAAVSVLPRLDTKDPVVHDMGNWSIPVSKHYRISYKNGFGSEVVVFIYSITFQHSGTYNEKGHYLAGIRMAARDISVNWGFDLDASSQLLQISNVGTVDNVIAGATVEITYTVKNWTRTLTTSKSFHVTGEGKIFPLD
jgi:hypothetical protein